MCKCDYGACKEGCDCKCHLPPSEKEQLRAEVEKLNLQVKAISEERELWRNAHLRELEEKRAVELQIDELLKLRDGLVCDCPICFYARRCDRADDARKAMVKLTEKLADPVPYNPNSCSCGCGPEHCRWCGSVVCACVPKRFHPAK